MLGYGGLRQRQLLNNFSADATLTPPKQPDDLDANRMPKGLRKQREFLVGLSAFDGPKIRLGIGRSTALQRACHSVIISHFDDD